MVAMPYCYLLFCFSSRRRHTRCALVTGVQTCALPIFFTRASLAESLRRDQKRVVVFNMHGGLSQLESWDPKPRTDTGGPFRAKIGRAPCRERVCQSV